MGRKAKGGEPPKPEKQPKKRGRPEHVPTQEMRNLVSLYLGTGCTQRAVAYRLGIAMDTMKKHYGPEMEMGKELNQMFWINSLAKAAQKGNVAAPIFMLKTRFGFKEQVEVRFPDDGEDGIVFTSNKAPATDD